MPGDDLRKRTSLQVNARIVELDVDDKWAKIDVEMCAHVAGIVINSANAREAKDAGEDRGEETRIAIVLENLGCLTGV